MKKYFFVLGFLAGLFYLSGCVKDRTATVFTNLNEVMIENIPADTSVGIDEILRIEPSITTSLNTETGMEYVWYAFTQTTQFAADTLSKEKALNVPVKMAPGEYSLVFMVKDTKTGIFYKNTSKLTVVNEFAPGIMILAEDGGNATLHFYNTAKNKFISDVYGNANANELLGKNPVSVSYYPKVSSMPSEVLILCKDGRGGIFADPVTFIKLRDLQKSFFLPLEPNDPLNVQCYAPRNEGLNDYLLIGGKAYNRAVNSGDVLFKPQMLGDYSLSPYFMYENSARITFYDEKNRRFLAHNNTAGALNPFKTDASVNIFDPNNIGLTMLYAGSIAQNSFFGLFRDPAGTQRYLLRMDVNALALTFTAKEKYAVTADELETATAYASSTTLANYLFYSSGSRIYAYNVVSRSGGLLKDLGSGYDINFLKLNGVELKVGFTNAALSGKKGGFATFTVNTTGGLNTAETRRKEGFCDKVMDLTNKTN